MQILKGFRNSEPIRTAESAPAAPETALDAELPLAGPLPQSSGESTGSNFRADCPCRLCRKGRRSSDFAAERYSEVDFLGVWLVIIGLAVLVAVFAPVLR